jgi:hypothetical protein
LQASLAKDATGKIASTIVQHQIQTPVLMAFIFTL